MTSPSLIKSPSFTLFFFTVPYFSFSIVIFSFLFCTCLFCLYCNFHFHGLQNCYILSFLYFISYLYNYFPHIPCHTCFYFVHLNLLHFYKCSVTKLIEISPV